MHRAIFLDRDGTINALINGSSNRRPDSPATPEEFHLLPGAGAAIRMVNEAGFLAIVVSNQPGIAKGRFTLRDLETVTQKMHAELAKFGARLDQVLYCPHHPEGVRGEFRMVCECRKPKPGLLLQGARSLQVDLSRSFLVGDTITDIQAGRAAGCHTLRVGYSGTDAMDSAGGKNSHPDHDVGSLLEAVEVILRGESWRSS